MLKHSTNTDHAKGKESFPLIEWMIVVTCLGIMLAIAIPNFLSH